MLFWVTKTEAFAVWEALCGPEVLKAHVGPMSFGDKIIKPAWALKTFVDQR